MTARNDITGDAIQTKTNNDAYRDGWDRIFSKPDRTKQQNNPIDVGLVAPSQHDSNGQMIQPPRKEESQNDDLS